LRRTVPIIPFLKGQAFDPELVEAMGAAFSKTCDAVESADRTDPITALVAAKIIELAERGLRNPTAMQLMAIDELKSQFALTPLKPTDRSQVNHGSSAKFTAK
jgi:hypothetical protein